MPDFCIVKPVADKLKQAFRDSEININTLYNMSSEERHATFSQYMTNDLAHFVNGNFEKAMVSKRSNALQEWAVNTLDPKSPQTNRLKEKLAELEKLGQTDPNIGDDFLMDLVADKMGVSLTPDELKVISEKSAKLEELYTKTDPVTGLPAVEYWQTRKELDNYIQSLNPSSRLKVATSVIGRGTMLFSVKSPLTNIVSNTVMGAVQGLERRIANGAYKGVADGNVVMDYVKKVNEIFQKSGYDISRMETLGIERVIKGEQITSAQGEGTVRAVGRWYEDIVFKQLMGAPDVASSSVAFADSANLVASKLAKGDKARATEIFKDAILIEPKTVEGQFVRAQAIADARYSTYTNDGAYSQLAMGLRSALNKFSKDARLGDQLMPFVKTPANVIEAGIDSAGIGAFKGFYKLPGAIRDMKAGNGVAMQEVVRDFTRAGLGMTLATVLAYSINPEDFIGAYDSLDSKGRELAKLKNAPYNSVKIGDKYISLDYFGPLASAFVGIMYARKYGNNPETNPVFEYVKGAGSQVVNIPGLTEVTDIVDGISQAFSTGKMGDIATGLTDEAIGFIRARTIPAIVSDIAKATDTNQRETEKGQLSKLQSGIPGWRQELQPVVNQITGNPQEGEDWLTTILFGSRMSTANDDLVTVEIDRLASTGNTPAITDIKRASQKVKAYKAKVDADKFTRVMEAYGKEYNRRATALIKSAEYKRMTDEEKAKALNSIRAKLLAKF